MEARLCDNCKEVIPPEKKGHVPVLECEFGGVRYCIQGQAIVSGAAMWDTCEDCFRKSLPQALAKFTADIAPFDGKKHYALNAHGEPVCPECGVATNRAYRDHPNLTCHACKAPMEKAK